MRLDKKALFQHILTQLGEEVASLESAARAAHEAATHEESKAEDQHDTRGLEASYLAGAQRARIESLKKVVALFQFAEPRDFAPNEPIAAGALVELALEGKRLHYLLVSQGGGIAVTFGGRNIQVITPQAPLGEALLGRRVGDAVEVEVEAQRAVREYEVVAVS